MKIGILYTGGTIGSVEGDGGLGPLNYDRFKQAFQDVVEPILRKQYPDIIITMMKFKANGTTLDSTNLQPEDWCLMATEILDAYHGQDAFMLLHGTDTMAWTASMLSFLMTGLDDRGYPIAVLNKPIIVTGSQLPLFETSADGYIIRFNTDALQNVCGAVTTCYQGIPEVCLYFNATLMRGNRTVKSNASGFDAFSSPNFPLLGTDGTAFTLNNPYLTPLPLSLLSLGSDVAYSKLSDQLAYITANINSTTVIPFLAFPAFYDPSSSVLASVLAASLEQGINGLILESYGAGNFPSGNPDNPTDGAVYKILKQAQDNGVVIMDCTQVFKGVVDSQIYAAGSWLSQVGAIGTYDMTPIAALTKLIYLNTLAQDNNNNWSQSTIEALMITNLAGEIMDVNVLDSRGQGFLAATQMIATLDGSAMFINDPARGLIIKDANDTIIYEFPLIGNPQLPGQLYMQANGVLAFYDQNGQPVYLAGDIPDDKLIAAKLIIEGSYAEGTLRLSIFTCKVSTVAGGGESFMLSCGSTTTIYPPGN